MRRFLIFCALVCLYVSSLNNLSAQNGPAIQWDKNFGGSSRDELYTLSQTSDGGYILGGRSESGISGDKSQPSKGGVDFWIVKVNGSGTKQWDKTFGTTGNDEFICLKQTSDGGFILGGTTSAGIDGDKTQPSKGLLDYWIIKTDAAGNKIWDKTFGGSNDDVLYAINQTSDGGYIIAGGSNSPISGDKSEQSRGEHDFWVLKLNNSGNVIWDKTYGGSGDDRAFTVQQTSDGGYILGGNSGSPISGDKTQPNKGHFDYWAVKLNANGSKAWDKSFGGSDEDLLTNLRQTPDGGFIIAGKSLSTISGDKTQPNKGRYDYWAIKLNVNGNIVWDKTLGGNRDDFLYDLDLTQDGGYIFTGISISGISGDKTQWNYGSAPDFWLVKLNSAGTKVWDKVIGGFGPESTSNVKQTSDGGYIVGGCSLSYIGADKTEANQGFGDFWIIKLGPEVLGVKEAFLNEVKLYPNPTSGLINLELRDQKVSQVTVCNALGQRVFSKRITQTPNTENIQLDLSKEGKGVYTIQILSDKQVIIRKVVLR